MLPGFNPAKTAAVARAVEALAEAAGRIADLRAAVDALEGIDAVEKDRLRRTIRVFADREEEAALAALDDEALYALADAAKIPIPSDDAEIWTFTRGLTDADVRALECARAFHTRRES